jgi:hypothetical protein
MCNVWLVHFAASMMLFPLIFVTVADEMGQALASQLFIPSPWFARFGVSTCQVAWPYVRIVFDILFVLAVWAVVLFLFIQDQIAFSFDDLHKTLLSTNHVAANLFLGCFAFLCNVVIMLQCWGLPRLQSIVVETTPFHAKPSAKAKADAPVPTVDALAIKARMDRDELRHNPNVYDDESLEIEGARRERRAKLLANVATATRDAQQRTQGHQRLSGRDREIARSKASVASRSGGGDEYYEVLEVRNAFMLPCTAMRGNVHWFLWFLVGLDAVQDAIYVAKYIYAAAALPEMTRPAEVPPRHAETMFDRVRHKEGRDADIDVVQFTFALVPAVIAVLLLLWTVLTSSVWFASCFRRNFALPPLPAIDVNTREMVVVTLPVNRTDVRIGQKFAKRVPIKRTNVLFDMTPRGAGSGDNDGESHYRAAGSNAVVDAWACAFRDDVVRLGTLLDQTPSLINERGGIGIRVAARDHFTKGPDPVASFAHHLPGVADYSPVDPDAPPFDHLTPPRGHGGTLPIAHSDRVTISLDQRTAELLPPGSGDPAFYAATPLHYAVLGNARSCVSALLSRGANTRIRCVSGLCTPDELANMLHHDGLGQLLAAN